MKGESAECWREYNATGRTCEQEGCGGPGHRQRHHHAAIIAYAESCKGKSQQQSQQQQAWQPDPRQGQPQTPADAKGDSGHKGGGKKGKSRKGKGADGDGSQPHPGPATPEAAQKTEWCPHGLNCQSMIKNGYCEKFHEKSEYRELKQKHHAQVAVQQGIELSKQRPLTGFEVGAQMAENAAKTLEAAQAEWSTKSGNKGRGRTRGKGKDSGATEEIAHVDSANGLNPAAKTFAPSSAQIRKD